MTKLETTSYYDALGDSDMLICVDTTDTVEDIKSKIDQHIADGKPTKFHIEVFHRDENVQSYTLLEQDEGEFDVWLNKLAKVLSDATTATIAYEVANNMPSTIVSPYTKYIDGRNPNGSYVIKSFYDEQFSVNMPGHEISIHNNSHPNDLILGEFDMTRGREYHVINHADKSRMLAVIDNISDEGIKMFAKTCLNIIPDYVFDIPASADCTERPASDIADGGLQRHLINTANVVSILMEPIYGIIESAQKQHETDMMIVAALFHDFLKFGWQEDYETYHVELFDHPRLAAEALRCIKGIVPDNVVAFITNCIETHMGSRNTNPDDPNAIPLPIPDTECKRLVHIADYVATRNNIAFINDNKIYALDTQNITQVTEFITIGEDEKITLKNALDEPINMTIAKRLNIHRDEPQIRQLWKDMIETGRATERQKKYIDLAQRMMYVEMDGE